MQGIQFDEDNAFKSGSVLGQVQEPAMFRWLMNKGVIKTNKQAFVILISISIVAAVSAIIILYKTFSANSEITRTPQAEEEVRQMENRPSNNN